MDTHAHHLPLCACNRTFRDWKETLGLAAHYAFLLTFVSPLTLLGACLISGFMTATITTVTHQSEELFFDEEPEFVDAQYRSTRDAVCSPGLTPTIPSPPFSLKPSSLASASFLPADLSACGRDPFASLTGCLS